MARVFRAWDPSFERVVALKTLKSEYLTHDNAPEYLRRFRREARAAGALSHPNIVRVFDVGPDFIVMEHVEGRTLRDLLGERERLGPEEALRLLVPIAEAVDHAHRAGIIHRDIKPANIMVQPDGTPKLMDFGIAHLETSVMTTAGEILGSPSYMSPELVSGGEVSTSSDLYALAVVAYEMLTGQAPFRGTITQVIYRVVHQESPRPRQWNASLPHWYDDVFARALGKNPATRYSSAVELTAALDLRRFEHVLASLVSEAGAPAAPHGSEVSRDGQLDDVLPAISPAATLGPADRRRSNAATLAASLGVLLAVSSAMLVPSAPDAVASSSSPTSARSGGLWTARRGTDRRAVATALRPTPAAPKASTLAHRDLPRVATAIPTRRTPLVQGPRSLVPPRTPAAAPKVVEPPAPTRGPVFPGMLVEPGPDVTPPQRIAGQTVFPQAQGRERLNGSVVISMLVDENGVPSELAVVESAGALLDAAALESVRSWRFEPARKAGVNVKVRWLARQTYRLTP